LSIRILTRLEIFVFRMQLHQNYKCGIIIASAVTGLAVPSSILSIVGTKCVVGIRNRLDRGASRKYILSLCRGCSVVDPLTSITSTSQTRFSPKTLELKTPDADGIPAERLGVLPRMLIIPPISARLSGTGGFLWRDVQDEVSIHFKDKIDKFLRDVPRARC